MKYDIKEFTLEEKMRLVCGKDWWHIEDLGGKLPLVRMSDGPSGLRRVNYVMENGKVTNRTTETTTAFPTLSVVANTWNRELAYLDGATIADEFIEYGRDVLLAPGVNIKRTPLCGRNFEYFSEDPYLSGTLATEYIRGAQDKGISTCIKHYAANNREYDRHYQSSDVDERTLREIYLRPFEIAMAAKPDSLMCSYNPINGIYGSENRYLLVDILRGEFGFDGMVVSDWYAVKDSGRTHKAGLDLEMPYRNEAYDELKRAYDIGYITEEEIDVCVRHILEFIEKNEANKAKRNITTTHEERHDIARRIAEEGIVLLKNEDNILPITGGKVYVAGPGATTPAIGGGGSSKVKSAYIANPLDEEIKARLGDNVEIIKGDVIIRSNGKIVGLPNLMDAAYRADAVVLCLGMDDTMVEEERDLMSNRLTKNMEDTIIEASKMCENLVVVLHGGSAIDVSPWIDKVKALVFIGFGGEGMHEAVADVLTGVVNPSGKLAETFPVTIENTPMGDHRLHPMHERYTEGVFVGYRYYDSFGEKVAFPFGHGLSYTSFEYSGLKLEKTGECECVVSFDVTNTGTVRGKEIAEVYVRDVLSAVPRPDKELKGYEKVDLAPGETKRVSISLDRRAFAYYNTSLHDWYIENGAFEILVGASSRDVRLVGKLEITQPYAAQMSSSIRR